MLSIVKGQQSTMKLRLLILSTIFFSLSTQAATPSPAQIEQFKKLPKAQQQALAKQYGVDLSTLNKSSSNSQKIENPDVVNERPEKKSSKVTTETELDKGMSSQNKLKESNDTTVASETDETEKAKPKRKLKPFGYELFAGAPSTFAPATDVPVPHEYVLGPGDTVKIQLFGKEYKDYSLTIDRNGTLILPETGPLQVVGMSFGEFKTFINEQIEQKVIGAKANVTMGQMRSIRIFVLGEAYQPGAYTVSSLSTIIHALFVSGGVTDVGSLRNIQLKRKGKIITTFDLYDLLLKGDTSKDLNLLPGDVVFVPPVNSTVGIDGEVKRPAIYELKGETNAQQLIELAGGLLSTAYPNASKLERLRSDGTRTVVDLDLSKRANKQKTVKSGDVLRIYSVLDEMENVVSLNGHVHRPGRFSYKPNMRLLDVIGSITALKANPDLDYGLIVREEPNVRTVSALSFSLKKAFSAPHSAENLALQERDKIYVFAADQARKLDKLLARLKAQARLDEPAKVVNITGHVRYPGNYPLTQNMTVADLVKASFDLKLETDMNYALLKSKNYRQNITEFDVISFNDPADLNKKLSAADKLYVFSINDEREEQFADLIEEIKQQTNKQNQQQLVTINGEVRFPGTYPLAKNMTLNDLVAAAGGFTESSFMNSVNVSRFNTNLKDKSEYSLTKLDISGGALYTYQLQPRDSIVVNKIPDWRDHETVELLGEFKFPGTYVINKGETLAELIQRAGGFTNEAFVNASIFTRSYLKEKEQALLADAERKLKRELVSAQINAGAANSSETILSLLSELEGVEASGRMVIEKNQLTEIDNSLELRNGDSLIIPRKNSAVSVIGEVYSATAQVYTPGWDMDDYIDAAGGFNQIAESSDAYIIKANGRVVGNSGWFSSNDTIEPGDTIVVPTNVDPVPTLTIWRDVTGIIYQSTVALAALAAL